MSHFIIYPPLHFRKSIFQRLFTGSLPRVERARTMSRGVIRTRNQTSLTGGQHKFIRTRSGQTKANHIFFLIRLLVCSTKEHAVSDFQQDVWPNLSRYSVDRKGKGRGWSFGNCPPQGWLVDSLMSVSDIVTQHFHQEPRQTETSQVLPLPFHW